MDVCCVCESGEELVGLSSVTRWEMREGGPGVVYCGQGPFGRVQRSEKRNVAQAAEVIFEVAASSFKFGAVGAGPGNGGR